MDLIGKYCDRGDCPDEDKELEAVSRFMSKSSESFTDWDWDGSELVVFDDDDEVERYSKSDLIEEGVLSKDTCKSCGQEVNYKSGGDENFDEDISISDKTLDQFELVKTDGVEYEIWEHKTSGIKYNVPIDRQNEEDGDDPDIERDFDRAEIVK